MKGIFSFYSGIHGIFLLTSILTRTAWTAWTLRIITIPYRVLVESTNLDTLDGMGGKGYTGDKGVDGRGFEKEGVAVCSPVSKIPLGYSSRESPASSHGERHLHRRRYPTWNAQCFFGYAVR